MSCTDLQKDKMYVISFFYLGSLCTEVQCSCALIHSYRALAACSIYICLYIYVNSKIFLIRSRLQQNGRFTLFSSKFPTHIYSILYGKQLTGSRLFMEVAYSSHDPLYCCLLSRLNSGHCEIRK